MRFVADPIDREQGAVLVRVHEGDFPPYVADGVVEVREGSTSSPAAGSALIELYDKATKRTREVGAFCQRTVWFSGDGGSDSRRRLALFSLYLFRMGPRETDVSARRTIEEHADAMRKAFSQQGMGCHVQRTHDSLIFRTAATAAFDEPYSVIELFPNEAMKLTVPAVMLDGDERTRACERLSPG